MTAAARAARAAVRIAGLRRSVVDLKRSIDFYCGALGFEAEDSHLDGAHVARLWLGSQWIELAEVEPEGIAAPAFAPDPRFQHAAVVAGDIDAAWRRLMAFRPEPITIGGPQRLPAAAGGVSAFKFRDPDGHPLELIAFPPGTGDPRWSEPPNSLTLGIDHFAIVVADAKRSIGFYAAHGFKLKSRQVNHGDEQARLDGLADPVVDVIAIELPGAVTPHVELLCYQHPAWMCPPGTKATCGRDVVVITSSRQLVEACLVDPDGHDMSFISSRRDRRQPRS